MPTEAAALTRTQGGSVPQPDPTTLTTQQMLREVAVLKEIVEAEIVGLDRVLTQRFDGMDRAIVLLQVKADKVPSETDVAVGNLKALHEARFRQIEIQFFERDTRAEQTARDIKAAVEAALKSASALVDQQNKSNQEAIAKSESSYTKQIDQILSAISNVNKTVDDKINDVKERANDIRSRLTTLEQRRETTRETQKDIWGYVVGAIGVVISIITVLFLVFNNSNRIEQQQQRPAARADAISPTIASNQK